MKLFQTALFGNAMCFTAKDKIITRSEVSYCNGDTVAAMRQHTTALEADTVTTYTTMHGGIVDSESFQGIMGALTTLLPVNVEAWWNYNNIPNTELNQQRATLSYINGDVAYSITDNGTTVIIEATNLVTFNSFTLTYVVGGELTATILINKRRIERVVAKDGDYTVTNIVLNLFSLMQKYFPYADVNAVRGQTIATNPADEKVTSSSKTL